MAELHGLGIARDSDDLLYGERLPVNREQRTAPAPRKDPRH